MEERPRPEMEERPRPDGADEPDLPENGEEQKSNDDITIGERRNGDMKNGNGCIGEEKVEDEDWESEIYLSRNHFTLSSLKVLNIISYNAHNA